jgi:LmbE family N-acetylglucosaminyl deacetylase
MKKILVVAPHPDDETLGCGATLLRHKEGGDEIHWLIATEINESIGFSAEQVAKRDREIGEVQKAYGFHSVHRLGFPTMRLDSLGKLPLIEKISSVANHLRPDSLYVPYRNDAHSDHAAVFDAVAACGKSFRYPFIRNLYAYETLSETEFGLRPDDTGFRPNLFIEVTKWIEQKISIMHLFDGEMGSFPFPRSETCIRAQAALRGSQAGVEAAEAFMILKEIR